jgi:hypothetical protein
MTAVRHLDPDLVERLAGRAKSTGVDVYQIASEIQEWAERRRGTSRPVRNPNGLLVTRVNKAILERQTAQRLTREQVASDLARYGELHVQLYALCVLRRPRPCDLAEALDMMRRSGYPQINPHTIERLRKLGAGWPGQAAEPQAQLSKAGGQG